MKAVIALFVLLACLVPSEGAFCTLSIVDRWGDPFSELKVNVHEPFGRHIATYTTRGDRIENINEIYANGAYWWYLYADGNSGSCGKKDRAIRPYIQSPNVITFEQPCIQLRRRHKHGLFNTSCSNKQAYHMKFRLTCGVELRSYSVLAGVGRINCRVKPSPSPSPRPAVSRRPIPTISCRLLKKIDHQGNEGLLPLC